MSGRSISARTKLFSLAEFMNPPAIQTPPQTDTAPPRTLPSVGMHWWGYLLAAVLVLGAGGGHLALHKSINKQARKLWHHVFEQELPSRSLEVRDWFSSRALKGELDRAITLNDLDEKQGKVFLVLKVSFSPEILGLRPMKPEELEHWRKQERDPSMSEGWLCELQSGWLNILLPDYSTVAPSGVSQNTDRPEFGEYGSMNLGFSQKPSEIVYSFYWKVDEQMAESGQLRFEFRHYRPVSLTKK